MRMDVIMLETKQIRLSIAKHHGAPVVYNYQLNFLQVRDSYMYQYFMLLYYYIESLL